MKFGLTVYGTTFHMGVHPKATKPRITVIEQMEMAKGYGLEGVEVPHDMLLSSNLEEVRKYAEEHNMFITIAAAGYNPDELKRVIQAGSKVNARNVRTVVGGADFGGDRRKMKGKWTSFLHDLLASFQLVTETAEELGVYFSVENHQDLASEELLWLCEEINSDYFGITLDTGNPLATAEHPIDFYEKVVPYVKNVHLKDYIIYWSEEGYRLVRCPVGQGVVDFPALFKIFEEHNPDVTMSIEHGALNARHVRVLQEDYWTEYPPRSAQQLTRVLRFVSDRARTVGDWRTPFEKEQRPEEIEDYEMQEMEIGMAYLSRLIRKHKQIMKESGSEHASY